MKKNFSSRIVTAVPRQNNDVSTAVINAFIDSDEDDDGNFYDKVASDEEYSTLNHQEQQKRMKAHKKSKKVDLILATLIKGEFFN